MEDVTELTSINVVVGVVAVLVLERMGTVIVGVVKAVRKNGQDGRVVCNPAPEVLTAFQEISASQAKIVDCLVHLDDEVTETRKMTGKLQGQVGILLERTASKGG